MAVDGYVWMHRAVYTINNKKESTKAAKFINYFREKIEKLHSLDIKVIVVWDGDKVKIKDKTNNKRYQERLENY